MNYKQIIVIAVGLVAISAAFLFPTWASQEFVDTDQGQVLTTNYARHLFNNPPEHSDMREPYVAWSYSVQAAVAYAVVTGILCYFLRTRKTRVIAEPPSEPSSAVAL